MSASAMFARPISIAERRSVPVASIDLRSRTRSSIAEETINDYVNGVGGGDEKTRRLYKAAAEEWACRALKGAECSNDQAAFAKVARRLLEDLDLSATPEESDEPPEEGGDDEEGDQGATHGHVILESNFSGGKEHFNPLYLIGFFFVLLANSGVFSAAEPISVCQ